MMKTTARVLLVIGFLWVCVSMARDKREAVTKPDFAGVNWTYTQEHFDKGLERYTIRVQTSGALPDQDVMKLAGYAKDTHTESDNMIIFFDQPDRMGAYARVDYPAGNLEKLENFARE